MAIDKVALGVKLRRCRENLKIDPSEVFSLTGISEDRLLQIEDGIIEPSGDEVLILADIYTEDYKYFLSNERLSASEKVETMYRKFGGSISKNDRRIIQEFIFMCECEHYIENIIDKKRDIVAFTPPIFKTVYKNDAIKVATPLRKALGYSGKELYSDIFYEFRRLGIHIFRKKMESNNISGLFIKHPVAGKCVLVNYHEDLYRQNFTLAHEVGHALMDTHEDFNISYEQDNRGDYKEMRANQFASSFLIPEELITPLKGVSFNDEVVKSLATKLKVNVQPLLIALKSQKIITEVQYKQYMALKIPQNLKTDFELTNLSPNILKAKRTLLEIGLSSYYVNNCYEAYEKKIISSGRFAELLLVSNIELPSVLSMFKMSL